MGSEVYGLSNVGKSGYMRSGACAASLLCQVGKYYVPARSGIGRSGLMRSNQTAAATALRLIDNLKISLSGANEVPECTFEIQCPQAEIPQEGDPVVIAVGSLQSPIFAGFLNNPAISRLTPGWFQVQCKTVGLARDLEKRIISGQWADSYAGAIITELLSAYTPQYTSTGNVEQGVYLTDFQADDEQLLTVCQRLAELSGFIFYLAPDRMVHFHRAELIDAPWDVTAAEHWGGLTINIDSSNLRNRIIVRYSELRAKAQAFAGDGDTRDFQLDYVPYALTSLAVNGSPVDYGPHYADDTETKQFSIDYERGLITPKLHAVLEVGDTLAVGYTAKIPARLIRHDRAAQADRIAREGGDGIYDCVLVNREILNLADARAAADAQLEQYAWPHITARYTRVEDLFGIISRNIQPGQRQTLNQWGFNETLTVSKIDLSILRPASDNTLQWQLDVELGPAAPRLETIMSTQTVAELEPDEITEEEDV